MVLPTLTSEGALTIDLVCPRVTFGRRLYALGGGSGTEGRERERGTEGGEREREGERARERDRERARERERETQRDRVRGKEGRKELEFLDSQGSQDERRSVGRTACDKERERESEGET
jgi:hypothetical protein